MSDSISKPETLSGTSVGLPDDSATVLLAIYDSYGKQLESSLIPVIIGGGDAFATLVITPNRFSHARLMQAMQNIVPEAAEPTPHHAEFAPMPEHEAAIREHEEGIRAEMDALKLRWESDEEPGLRNGEAVA